MVNLNDEQKAALFPHGLAHAIVEFKTGDRKMALVVEYPQEVKRIVNECEERLCTLTGWTTSGTYEIHTRPDNVVAIRVNEA